MTQQQFNKWLTEPQVALQSLLKDLSYRPPFDSEVLQEPFIAATGHSLDGKETAIINQAIATWAYNNDCEELFNEALACYFSQYNEYCPTIYNCQVKGDYGSIDEATLRLSRTKNKIVTIVQSDFSRKSTSKDYEIQFYELNSFDLQKVVYNFINEVEDYAAYNGGFDLITENIEELEEEGQIGGSVIYTSYLSWIKEKETQYILV